MDSGVLGSTDVWLSRLGLGGFELGPEAGETPDVDRAANVIADAAQAGVNWLDTSENYLATANESLIGAALARVDAGSLVSTKVAPGAAITGGGSGFRPEQIHAACEGSLRRLGREVLDVYFLHWPDETGVPLEETWGAMAELVARGLVRAIGLSNYAIADIERCHEQRPVDVVQTGLSMIDYLDDRDLIRRCGELGIGVVIYEPLASGILTGKTPQEILALWTGPWLESAFYRRLLAPGRIERSFAVVDGLRPIADQLGAAIAQVAIAWVLDQPGVTGAIAGSRNGRHVRSNAGAVELDLSDVREQLEHLLTLGPNTG
jgi:aryl-alcohol dehydrogenase-like predicted oxidoreductase